MDPYSAVRGMTREALETAFHVELIRSEKDREEAQRTIAAQAEELARVTAERGKQDEALRYQLYVEGPRSRAREHQMRVERDAALAQLARMTERHGRLREAMRLVAERATKQFPYAMAWAVLADDDAAAKEAP